MTGLNIHTHVRDIAPLVFLGDGVRRTGDWFVGSQEVQRTRGKYIENQPSPQPSRIGEGVNIGGQSGVSHEIGCHPELVSGSHKMQQHAGQSDVQKTLKHRCQLSVYKMLKRVQHDINFLKRTYSLINLFSYLPRKRCAFTLAEVLITLGIIGIVAAMTMPSLINNYQKKQTIVRLKKVYSIISQAYTMSETDNGPAEDWIDSSQTINTENVKKYVQSYWLPYFKSIQECSKEGDCSYNVNVKRPDGQYSIALVGNNRYTIILSDGTLIAFVPFGWDEDAGVLYWGTSQRFYIDLNGPKRPNVLGKDVFILTIYNKRITGNCYTFSENSLNAECSKTGSAQCCSMKIIRDGWEIKDDYPW